MNFDLIVVGAGSGGLPAARKAADLGKKVLLVEKSTIGGTCVNVGCVPKKICSNLAQILFDKQNLHKSYFITEKEHSFDFKKFKDARDSYIKRLNNIYHDLIKKNQNITYIEGSAEVFGDHITVNDQKYTFEHCLLATGSKSRDINKGKASNDDGYVIGSHLLHNSDDFFKLDYVPSKSVIIGSGYIGIEIAFILKALGSDVTLIARNNKLLSHFDDILGQNIHLSMEKLSIKIIFNAKVLSLVENKDNSEHQEKKMKTDSKNWNTCDIKLISDGQEQTLDAVDFRMCAIGRDCDISYIKENIDQHDSYLKVDDNFRTSIPNVFAVGDLLGPPFMLTPYAIFCSRLIIDFLYKGSIKSITKEFQPLVAVPSVIFSHPPCASVGLSESDARKMSSNVEIYESTFSNLLFCFEDVCAKEKSKFKVVCADGKVVGLHLFGTGSDEIIQGFAVAMKMGCKYEDFKKTIAVHPTAAEEVVTMK